MHNHDLDPQKANKLAGSSVAKSSAIVASATLLSRIMGLLRDIVLANLVGANDNADAFFIAFRIPNFLRRLFAEGAFAQAFVPILADTRERGGIVEVRKLIDRVAGVLGGTLTGLSILVVIISPLVATVFAPGFLSDPEKLALTSDLIKLTFPYLLLISLTGFAGAVLNSYQRFVVPALTPILLNLSLISVAIWLAPTMQEPSVALAIGVLVAGFAQLLFQFPALADLDLIPRPRWEPKDNGVQRVIALMVPALFGVSVTQINLLLDTVLASFLPAGSVSWLYYSDRLTELPLGVFAIAIATVILPTLSRHCATGDDVSFSRTLVWGTRNVLFIAIPSTLALVVLAEPLITTLFQYGAFQSQDMTMAAASLRAYTLGLGAFMLIKVFAPGFYARKDMKTPVRIGIIAMVANMILNLTLVFFLHKYFQLGHVGLALATSVSAWINATLLYRTLLKEPKLPGSIIPWNWLCRVAIASGFMAFSLWYLAPQPTAWAAWPWWLRVVELATLCGGGLLTLLIGLLLFGIRPKDFLD